LDLLKRYRDAGTERVVFSLPSENTSTLIPLLDRFERYIDAVK